MKTNIPQEKNELKKDKKMLRILSAPGLKKSLIFLKKNVFLKKRV